MDKVQPTQQITLAENIVVLIRKTVETAKQLREEIQTAQKQAAEKIEQVKDLDSKLQGILLGIVAAEGIDLETSGISINDAYDTLSVYAQSTAVATPVVKPTTKIRKLK